MPGGGGRLPGTRYHAFFTVTASLAWARASGAGPPTLLAIALTSLALDALIDLGHGRVGGSVVRSAATHSLATAPNRGRDGMALG